jgi:hypothetical protein
MQTQPVVPMLWFLLEFSQLPSPRVVALVERVETTVSLPQEQVAPMLVMRLELSLLLLETALRFIRVAQAATVQTAHPIMVVELPARHRFRQTQM